MFKRDNIVKNTIFVVICLVAYKVVDNHNYFFTKLAKLISILSPFFWGLAFAYVLNPLMMLIEKHAKNIRRAFSIVIVYFIFIFTITMFTTFIVPVISDNIKDLYNRSSTFPDILNSYIEKLPNNNFLLENLGIMELIENNSSNLLGFLVNMSNFTFNSLVSGAVSFTSGLFNFILGIFVSIYFLFDKENLLSYMKKTIRALFPEKKSDFILEYFSKVNFYFNSFLIGKMLDSTIIGFICYIGFLILKVRYALLLSMLVGLLNMIPYFGPFMGAVPAIILTLIYSPIQALWVTLFILALQQFDGWYLGPKILGNTVGASPLFIIFSILVGGGFAGPLGMLLAVPLFKSLFLLWDDFIDSKLHSKNI